MIRQYTKDDYDTIAGWWREHRESYPPIDFVPDTTFILEADGIPMYAISVILTNTPICYLEYFVSNPNFDSNHNMSQQIVDYAAEFAKSKGHKYSIIFSYKDKVKARYADLGMKRTLDNLSSFVRGL